MHSTSAWIAMGTNMPFDGVSGAALLARARDDLMSEGVNVLRCSGVWQSEAWPAGTDQSDYFNAVLEADAGDHDPRVLYEVLRAIEQRFGRERRERWGARTLDLDIVAMGDLAGSFDGIELPHPRMGGRSCLRHWPSWSQGGGTQNWGRPPPRCSRPSLRPGVTAELVISPERWGREGLSFSRLRWCFALRNTSRGTSLCPRSVKLT
jgi:2-amino-4-hydroxy-6-hydroxymethyldihydropteridine diphosphokinase